ncbi:MAG: hypothetical protein GF398_12875 [Chitinivibrionales bacterium]|nr:hypothetical protein [Chitinivibrionales bacterium]
MVDYDSIIPPGQAGKLVQEVDIKGKHGGTVKKSVRIQSNAKNEPTVSVILSVKILPVVGVSAHYIQLKDMHDEPFVLTLKTEKPDLKVNQVTFKTRGARNSSWQVGLPAFINYTLTRAAKPDNDGYFDYTLQLKSKLNLKDNKHGSFLVATNHPHKKEIEIRGRIDLLKPH